MRIDRCPRNSGELALPFVKSLSLKHSRLKLEDGGYAHNDYLVEVAAALQLNLVLLLLRADGLDFDMVVSDSTIAPGAHALFLWRL